MDTVSFNFSKEKVGNKIYSKDQEKFHKEFSKELCERGFEESINLPVGFGTETVSLYTKSYTQHFVKGVEVIVVKSEANPFIYKAGNKPYFNAFLVHYNPTEESSNEITSIIEKLEVL